jgi:hypothetical protein
LHAAVYTVTLLWGDFSMRFSTSVRSSALSFLAATALFAFTALPAALAVEAPQLVQKDGRYTLLVEGRPYLILGGQIHNSSGWPSELPQVWQSMAALHANTVEAPVYWEQFEPQQGRFDFTNVDQIVEGARANNLHVVFLWFGTWKTGVGEGRSQALSAHHPAGWRADRRAVADVAQHTGGGQSGVHGSDAPPETDRHGAAHGTDDPGGE